MHVAETQIWPDPDATVDEGQAAEDRQRALTAFGMRVYAIIDGARHEGLSDWLTGVQPDAAPLYDLGVRPDLAEVTPWFVSLESQSLVSRAATTGGETPGFTALWQSNTVLFVLSDAPADSLLRRMRRNVMVADEANRTVHLRFWDPAMAPMIVDALQADGQLARGPFLPDTWLVAPTEHGGARVARLGPGTLDQRPLILTKAVRARLSDGVAARLAQTQVAAAMELAPNSGLDRLAQVTEARDGLIRAGWPTRALPIVLSVVARHGPLAGLPPEARALVGNTKLSHRARGTLLDRHIDRILAEDADPKLRATDDYWLSV